MHSDSNTLFIGSRIIKLNIVDSTNNYACQLLSKNKPLEGTAIIAQSQSAGKGQYGNNWESAPNQNLTFSIILYPKFISLNNLFSLNQVISLGVKDFVEHQLKTKIELKWPNDILCNEKKTAGILIENSVSGEHISSSIIGIGININQINFGNDLPHATSFKIQSGKNFDLGQLVTQCFKCIEQRYLMLRDGKSKQIAIDYLSSLYGLNLLKEYRVENQLINGRIRGLEPSGKLIVEINGKLKSFENKEIAFNNFST